MIKHEKFNIVGLETIYICTNFILLSEDDSELEYEWITFDTVGPVQLKAKLMHISRNVLVSKSKCCARKCALQFIKVKKSKKNSLSFRQNRPHSWIFFLFLSLLRFYWRTNNSIEEEGRKDLSWKAYKVEHTFQKISQYVLLNGTM
jgi:hypothetical protein